ncbi:MAG TPA: hypothetical protein ENN21_01245 [Spirochaetes bacterium]|nr:hypothetical protein [Spirochaetota bacterium]
MNTDFFIVFVPVAGVFGAIGSLAAFLITYNEYCKHPGIPPGKRVRMALETSLLAFVMLAGLTFLALFLLM